MAFKSIFHVLFLRVLMTDYVITMDLAYHSNTPSKGCLYLCQAKKLNEVKGSLISQLVVIIHMTLICSMNRPYTQLLNMLKLHHQASFARYLFTPSLPSCCFHVGFLFVIAALRFKFMVKFKICILKTRLGGDLAGLMSSRIRAIAFRMVKIATIKDKSVDTFEQNKRFPSASFRNFINVLFSIAITPLLLFNVEIRSVDTVTWLQHWKGERGSKWQYWRLENSLVQRNRSSSESVSTAFVHDCLSYILRSVKLSEHHYRSVYSVVLSIIV